MGVLANSASMLTKLGRFGGEFGRELGQGPMLGESWPTLGWLGHIQDVQTTLAHFGSNSPNVRVEALQNW